MRTPLMGLDPDDPKVIEATKRYLEDFALVVAHGLVAPMPGIRNRARRLLRCDFTCDEDCERLQVVVMWLRLALRIEGNCQQLDSEDLALLSAVNRLNESYQVASELIQEERAYQRRLKAMHRQGKSAKSHGD